MVDFQKNKQLPRNIVVLGMPKTGTTILFSQIEKGLPAGRYTHFFEPHNKSDFQRKRIITRIPQIKNVIVKDIYTHQFDVSLYESFEKKIYIIRDPRDRLISRFLYSLRCLKPEAKKRCRKYTHEIFTLLQKKQKNPSAYPFIQLIQDVQKYLLPEHISTNPKKFTGVGIRLDMEYAENFFDKEDWFMVRYEDIVDKKYKQLELYLGISLNLEAEVSGTYSIVKRSTSYNNWKHWFTPQDVAYLQPRYSSLLEQYGYDTSWDLAQHQSIDSSECEEYISNIWRNRTFRHDLLWKWRHEKKLLGKVYR